MKETILKCNLCNSNDVSVLDPLFTNNQGTEIEVTVICRRCEGLTLLKYNHTSTTSEVDG